MGQTPNLIRYQSLVISYQLGFSVQVFYYLLYKNLSQGFF